MSDFFIHKMIASRASYINVHLKEPMKEEDFVRFEEAFIKPYELDQFFLFIDARDVNTDNLPSWFVEKMLLVIHRQRPQRDKIIGIIFLINSETMANFIKGIFTIYHSERPRLVTNDEEEACAWLTDKMIDTYGMEQTMEFITSFALETSSQE